MKTTKEKLFKAFLKNEGAWNVYKDNLSTLRGKTVSEFYSTCYRPIQYTNACFIWESTPQGQHFWEKLDKQWVKILKHVTTV